MTTASWHGSSVTDKLGRPKLHNASSQVPYQALQQHTHTHTHVLLCSHYTHAIVHLFGWRQRRLLLTPEYPIPQLYGVAMASHGNRKHPQDGMSGDAPKHALSAPTVVKSCSPQVLKVPVICSKRIDTNFCANKSVGIGTHAKTHWQLLTTDTGTHVAKPV